MKSYKIYKSYLTVKELDVICTPKTQIRSVKAVLNQRYTCIAANQHLPPPDPTMLKRRLERFTPSLAKHPMPST